MSVHRWLDLYLVRVLRHELHGKVYKKCGYMCITIDHARFMWFNKLLKRRVFQLIDCNLTLAEYIVSTMEDYGYTLIDRQVGYFNLTQSQKHLTHILFWERTITHLIERKQGLVKFNPQDLGIYKTLTPEKQHA